MLVRFENFKGLMLANHVDSTVTIHHLDAEMVRRVQDITRAGRPKVVRSAFGLAIQS